MFFVVVFGVGQFRIGNKKSECTESKIGQVRIWRKWTSSTEYWHKAEIDDCSVRVLSACTWQFFHPMLMSMFTHKACVCANVLYSSSKLQVHRHAEVSVHKLKWFKNVNKCVATTKSRFQRCFHSANHQIDSCSHAHRFLKYRRCLSSAIVL